MKQLIQITIFISHCCLFSNVLNSQFLFFSKFYSSPIELGHRSTSVIPSRSANFRGDGIPSQLRRGWILFGYPYRRFRTISLDLLLSRWWVVEWSLKLISFSTYLIIRWLWLLSAFSLLSMIRSSTLRNTASTWWLLTVYKNLSWKPRSSTSSALFHPFKSPEQISQKFPSRYHYRALLAVASRATCY